VQALAGAEQMVGVSRQEIVPELMGDGKADEAVVGDVAGVLDAERIPYPHQKPRDTWLGRVLCLHDNAIRRSDLCLTFARLL
jgi:hypothetical protein